MKKELVINDERMNENTKWMIERDLDELDRFPPKI